MHQQKLISLFIAHILKFMDLATNNLTERNQTRPKFHRKLELMSSVYVSLKHNEVPCILSVPLVVIISLGEIYFNRFGESFFSLK